jgi:hypothetical protein
MPYLFCQEHGREQEAKCEEEQESFLWLGETVLIVSGPLKSPSWRCASCNVRLRRGQRAWMVTAFARPSPEDLGRYDYATEREYFNIEHAEARWYGTASPPSAQRQHFAAPAIGHQLVPDAID